MKLINFWKLKKFKFCEFSQEGEIRENKVLQLLMAIELFKDNMIKSLF